MRFLVLLILLVCFVSIGRFAFLRYKKEVKPVTRAEVWEADGRLRAYPTAEMSKWKHLVRSPYLADTLLDTTGYMPGELMRCGGSKQPFYVPLRDGLHYGEIVGDWILQRFDRQGPVDYRVRFVTEVNGVIGRGRRIRAHGRALPAEEQTTISLEGHFEDDRLLCSFDESIGAEGAGNGRFEWVFSSERDELQGTAYTKAGVIDSKGRRVTGSRGSIPASGTDALDFVPEGWALLDSVSGLLNETQGSFLVMAMEEKGATPFRWLVLAQREHKLGDYQTILASPTACRQRLGEGEGDPFQGLFLPYEVKRPGIFGLRHHASRDYQHAGIDLWFQYDASVKDWRLSEGRRYRFDLDTAEPKLVSDSVLPGITLAAFDIEAVQFDAQGSGKRQSEITASQ